MDKAKKSPGLVSGCNQSGACNFTLAGDCGLMRKMVALLEQEGLPVWITKKLKKPGLARHAFTVSVAECPNACSQPQIKDFGAVHESLPGKGSGSCNNCGLCLGQCREAAILLGGSGPVIDFDRCVRCGACAKVCPANALVAKRTGFSVYLAGRVGRHPRLGIRVLEMTDEAGVLSALKAVVRFYINEGRAGERFGELADRVGTALIKREIDSAVSRAYK